MAAIVAIVGRPNVGKSTLFNRLIGWKKSITDETPGVTRDRIYDIAEWNGKKFFVIDTGGFLPDDENIFQKAITSQIKISIQEASVILFMVDGQSEITDLDYQMAEILRKTSTPVLLVVNKIDDSKHLYNVYNFYKIGFSDVYPISALNGSGTGELLDKITSLINDTFREDYSNLPRIAVIGRPNVGKSSFINTLLGEERSIVTPIPGTTRDSIDTLFDKFNFKLILVDTAGLRKKAKITDNIEYYSTLRTINAIEHSDVCILLVDATEGFTNQDKAILSLAARRHKGIVLCVNKWDLISKTSKTFEEYKMYILKEIEPFRNIPIFFISVFQKQRLLKVLKKAVEVYENKKKRIRTHELNKYLLDILEKYPPPAYKGKHIKSKYVTQLPVEYPAFVIFCNYPQYVKQQYVRFIINKLQEQYNFEGVPIEVHFRKK
ncbi:MAG: ribosome biogenesis GTPase Der [Bacteroidales bacterium]|nr:ribosome biogenesis GTPase Der [Bacteroidales bacterium]